MPFLSSRAAQQRRALRDALRARRADVPAKAAAAAAAAACGWLAATSEFRTARTVAGYMAVRGELDPMPLLEQALAAGKSVCLPRVTAAGEMIFVPWDARSVMRLNRYGIPEPECAEAGAVAPGALDLVVVPLVGFDARGTRLGTGAGYYDRAFAFKGTRRRENKPVLAGYAFSLQECNNLEAAAWDVPLDLVATEQGIVRCTPAPLSTGDAS